MSRLQIPQIDMAFAKQFADRWNASRPVALIFKQPELQLAVDLANYVLADSFKQAFAQILAEQNPKIQVVNG